MDKITEALWALIPAVLGSLCIFYIGKEHLQTGKEPLNVNHKQQRTGLSSNWPDHDWHLQHANRDRAILLIHYLFLFFS
ncbi:hypothetical protein QP775_11270 [Paenibacillus sp. UMB4589-SE434]|nr:hypothetical protein [Paenibacillus sp. UMB4589-SE434]